MIRNIIIQRSSLKVVSNQFLSIECPFALDKMNWVFKNLKYVTNAFIDWKTHSSIYDFLEKTDNDGKTKYTKAFII